MTILRYRNNHAKDPAGHYRWLAAQACTQGTSVATDGNVEGVIRAMLRCAETSRDDESGQEEQGGS
jgi:hypothetical protein